MNFRKRFTSGYFLAFGIGLIYLWFGLLKFFPGLSPAEELAKNTISILTFYLLPPSISIILLAIWETAIGILFLLGLYKRPIILITLLHMILTFSPILFFPEQISNGSPFHLSLVGQYILKNVVIIGALLVLYQKVTEKQLKSKSEHSLQNLSE